MKILVLFLLFTHLGGYIQHPICDCKKATDDEITHVTSTLIELRKQRVKSVRGQVLDYAGAPIKGVLVEVFTRPDLMSRLAIGAPERMRKQKRVAACLTGDSGEFCFSNIPAGSYELRISKSEWALVSGVIIVDPKNRNERRIIIEMSMAI